MALEPGGYADKLGNRYEGRWIVRQLLRVLNEDLRHVECETVGDSERGVDLWVERPNGIRQAQQCKSRNLSKDKWSIADLFRAGILTAMQQHLDRMPSNEFALVTAIPSTLIHDICESARNSKGDPEAFFENQIKAVSEKRRKAFDQFCKRLGLNHNHIDDRARAFGYLRRFYIEYVPDTNTSREDLLGQAERLVQTDSNRPPSSVVAVLADFAQNNLRRQLDGPAIGRHLESQGYQPRRLAKDTRIQPTVRELQGRFLESIKSDLIGGELIPRKEADTTLELLKEHCGVIVHGNPGQGKSGVLYEVVKRFDADDTAYVPFRLDRQEPSNTTRQFGADFGLPESPVLCLDAIAGSRPVVLVLDQLDALRWTSHHSVNALEVCKALVNEVRSLRASGKEISVILACRTYDMQNDPEIARWLRAENEKVDRIVEVPVGELTTEAVGSVVTSAGQNWSGLSKRQQDILKSPQHLAMWVRIVKERGAFEFQNRVQLIHKYWTGCMREMGRIGVAEIDADGVLTRLIDFMEENGSVSAPRSLVSEMTVLDALCACGLLRADDRVVTFSHQSYLDYQIASRVVREIYSSGRDICTWLGVPEQQSLFRREQLRQALCLLADESPNRFLDAVEAILDGKDIRFHLKHLCLEVVSQLDHPSERLLGCLTDRASTKEWREHVIGTVFLRHPSFVRHLISDGTIAEWLEVDEWRNPALWLLRSVADAVRDEVTAVLRPYATRDEEWMQRVLACLSLQVEEDSDAMFDLRLELARRGIFQEYVNWGKLQTHRSLQLLEAVVSEWSSDDISKEAFGRSRGRRSRFESWSADDMAAFTQAAREFPKETWEMFLPHIHRLAPQESEDPEALELWQDGGRAMGDGMEGLVHGLVRLTIESGKCLARNNGRDFWERTESLRSSSSPVVQYILIEAYASLSVEMSDQAIGWLLEDTARLNIGTGNNEPEWNPAARLIEALSPHCSVDVFRRLEETIVHYHSPNERRAAEWVLPAWKEGYFDDYWGRAQHFLLPSLCRERCNDETIGLIGVLQRKYEGYAQERFVRGMRGRAGGVGSTLPSASLERISDRRWLQIVYNRSIPEDDWRSRRWVDGHYEESSVRQFSQDLQRVAKRFPGRFGRLALQFSEDVHPDYGAAILDALMETEPKEAPEDEKAAWAPATTDLVEAVLAKFRGASSRTYASRFCWLMASRAEERWSDQAIEQLIDYATGHSDPAINRLCVGNRSGNFNADEASVVNLENNAINCVRGVAARAIGQQLWNHPDLLERFRPTIAQLCRDPHPAVRMAAVEACLPVLNMDRDFAIECFFAAVEGDLRIAAGRESQYFFNCGMQSHHSKFADLVGQMLDSPLPDVVVKGAFEVGARWLFHDYFNDEVDKCLQGSAPQRKGLAQVAADFVSQPQYLSKCARVIEQLKDDPDKDVRHALHGVLRNRHILHFPEGVKFVQGFVDSQTFRDDPTSLIHILQGHSGRLLPFSDVLFAMCDQFVGPLRDASRDSSFGISYDVSESLPLLMRLYEQADQEKATETVNRCLDAFDAMFEKRVGVVRELAKVIG